MHSTLSKLCRAEGQGLTCYPNPIRKMTTRFNIPRSTLQARVNGVTVPVSSFGTHCEAQISALFL
ncbi:hypothetical protein N7509_003428 [Penicillium cosmopolitanum]|uniref:Uncharacterized protein n=1 Tax=Penicillium cosmopolitanum TaxID=1131564 RepID=A0A9X0BBG8_9EURO|nr:uncharacterized protein N7509_003428 [Penicillium cosmopolitanum]KAJ5403557.1 hypothetical protein N7509_003428 [Penicillium cosmopolitanum]